MKDFAASGSDSIRRRHLLSIARDAGKEYFDPETQRCVCARDTFWFAIALAASDDPGDRRLAEELFTTAPIDDATHTPSTLIAVLHSGISLSTSTRDRLIASVGASLAAAALVEWRDGNVNHPLAAYCALILGGELCNESLAVELGYRKLRTLQHVIGNRRHIDRRQAEMSEYTSPTYTALDLWSLSLIGTFARHENARSLALFLEEQLWLDVAMHYHAPSGEFIGPFSRAYQTDSTGGYSALHATMMVAAEIDLHLDAALPRRFEHSSNLVQNALIAILPFHFPERARVVAFEKPFPYCIRKTTYGELYHENSTLITRDGQRQFAFDHEAYRGGWSDLTTYLTREFALGTAALPYVNGGQCDSFTLRIRRELSVEGEKHYRAAYTRGVFNDSIVGARNFCHVTQSEIDRSYLYEEGRCAAYQHRNRAIVLYHPKRSQATKIRSFRVDLIFSHSQPFDALIIDGDSIDPTAPDSIVHDRFIFQDADTYGVVVPLSTVPGAGRASHRIRTHEDFFLLSSFCYDGDARDFTREELLEWHTGFYIELSARDEFNSLDSFLAHAQTIRVAHTADARALHHIGVTTGADRMTFAYDHAAERILERQWNGVDETIEHFLVETIDGADPIFTPATLFGDEAFEEFRAKRK